MEKIGYQSGIKAAIARLRKLDPGGTNAQGTGAWDKLERTLSILAADHDAQIPDPPPPPPPPPPPTYVKVAPRVAFKANGSDARYCTVGQPGVVPDPNAPPGHTVDEHGATYDDNGLCKNGKRSDGPAVTSAREIDGRPYCSLPTMGDPTKNTGSWAI